MMWEDIEKCTALSYLVRKGWYDILEMLRGCKGVSFTFFRSMIGVEMAREASFI